MLRVAVSPTKCFFPLIWNIVIDTLTEDGNNFANLVYLFPGIADLTIDLQPFLWVSNPEYV
jgi:hypothetical protein